MKVKIRKIFFEMEIGIVLIVLSCSICVYETSIGDLIEYMGYLLSLIAIFHGYVKKIKKEYWKIVVILFLFLIGIFVQNLGIPIKIRLGISMLIIAIFMCIPSKVIMNADEIRRLTYMVLIACCLVTIMALATGNKLYSKSYQNGSILDGDGLSGLTCGFAHKNYFAAMILMVFIGIRICNSLGNKTKSDLFLLFLCCCLLVASGSRGAQVLLVIYIIIENIYKIVRVPKKQLLYALLLIFVMLICIGIFFLKNWALNSANYLYRVRGLTNYLNYVSGDNFHIWFGNAELAYGGNGSFTENIRSVVGWDGTTEMGFLNILIKNGLIGLLAYMIIFYSVVKKILRIRSSKLRYSVLGIVVVLIISSFVETYLVNLEFAVSMFCFVCIYGVNNIQEIENNN